MLCGEHPAPQEQSIFKVCQQLRQVNERTYEPEILSIGPYHYGKDKFKSMEEQKMRYMRQLLRRRKEESVDRYMPTLRELEQLACYCYSETFDHLTPEKFLAMMLIDGCFIVELFHENNIKELRDSDQLMESDWIQYCLRRDLLLLKNQLPFFLLNKLYDLTKDPNEHLGLIGIATGKHLLHLIHTCRTAGLPDARRQNCRARLNMFVSTATELRESGVKLRVRQGCDPMDIIFENGALEIPAWRADDDTEDYQELLGDDEVVAQMFNKMCDFVILSDYYDDIYHNMNVYCNKRRNVWMAKLGREYFHSPWAFLSVLAAIVLLLLTAVQTVFSILSYTKQS
ncbi:hypothetical protein BT93_H1313 [Corymbia citriodora subsp. variegata]|nr:hypothetical protein BT93_H1313 [Corymbia citriodora subsp. variegata]